MVVEPLSDYEQQRLANMARNQAHLAALGLDGDNSLKEKKKKPQRVVRKAESDDDDDESLAPRRSTRNSGAPQTYTELSDAWCLREEKQLERQPQRHSDRPARLRKAPTSYADTQGAEILEKEEINSKRRRERARDKQIEDAAIYRASMAAAAASAPRLPSMNGSQSIFPAPFMSSQITKKSTAEGPAARCWRCGQLWAIRKSDGLIRDHTCIPMAGASVASVAPTPPLLPSM